MLKALDFMYGDRMLSEYQGWFIQTISSTTTQQSGGEVKVYQDFVYRKPIPYFQGATYQGNKTLKIRIGKTTQFNEFEADSIRSWLEGGVQYKPIIFIQDDLVYLHMNVIIQKVSIGYVGNQPAYLTLDIICDSPFAYEKEKTYTLTSSTTKFINSSSLKDYTYPIVQFTCNKANGVVTLKNVSDNNRMPKFTGLSVGEVITIDNNLQIVTSSLRNNILPNFNKQWFRLVQGTNTLELTGDFTDLTIKYRNVRQVL
ncbi:MAG: phage tail domain-containing protein [Sarcina sp.]